MTADREQYIRLLFQRDQLEKEAMAYQARYLELLGDKTLEAFELKVNCIALKKSIAFVLANRNHGKKVDEEEMRQYVARQMQAYFLQLDALRQEVDDCRRGVPIALAQEQEIKRIYRRVMRKLHPDVNPVTAENEELMALVLRVMDAYKRNDLKQLRELEVLSQALCEQYGIETEETEIEDLEEKIAEAEEEINMILTTEPYLYKALLEDEDRLDEKRAELDLEIEEYRAYQSQLEEQLKELQNAGE